MLTSGELFASLKGATKDGEMIGSVARVPRSVRSGRLTQDTVKLVFRRRDNDFEQYVYWVLRTPQYRAYCAGRATGSAVVALSRDDFLAYPVPPLTPDRMHCVRLLETIEQRIAVLRQTNATLESIAQALFKSWFIDFDPVSAKAEGREPEGMDAATAALFPAEFEESALGLIPKGWRAGDLAMLCSDGGGFIQTGPFGSQLHASDYEAEGVPVVMPQDLEGRRISTERVARVSNAHVERLSRHKLMVGDVVFSRRGDVGRHAAVTVDEAGWLCGTGCLLVRPGRLWPSSAYVSQALATSDATEWLKRHAVGATMPNLNTGILGALPLLLPNHPVLAAFEVVGGALEARISATRAQAAQLAALRDSLLPRLISGKLRLPEAREQLEDALA
ncbi:MAG: restriction endonuclease subunit S [Proteobacteria bacterium]|nr:restriction endonuclease subunit S [Pseudomonadota bacterium]